MSMNEETISNYLSEISGFCHKGFTIKTEKNKTFATGIKWDTNDPEDINYLPDEIEIPNEILTESESN